MSNKKIIPANKLLPIRLGYHEKGLRILVKKAGGRWDKLKQVWELPYKEICTLGLEKRIIKEHVYK